MAEVKLKEIPDETFRFILKTQGEIKVEKNVCQFSIEKTIYKMLKELQEIKEGKRLLSTK